MIQWLNNRISARAADPRAPRSSSLGADPRARVVAQLGTLVPALSLALACHSEPSAPASVEVATPAMTAASPSAAAASAGHREGGAASAGATRWGREYFPNVPLVTDAGRPVRFFDDLIANKIVVINFIFTSCTKSCPLETARLLEVHHLLGERVGRDVFMYSITIDPDNDTPEVLAAYKQRFGIGAGWTFLTGSESDITLLRHKLGLLGDVVQNGSRDHNLSLIVGNQTTGRWMKRSPFENPLYLTEQIGSWLSNWTAPVVAHSDYRQAPEARQTSPGETLFRSRCAPCHTIGGMNPEGLALGLLVGPDLLGVTRRRDASWLSRWISEPDQMLASGDPLALALFDQYRRLPMPNLKLRPEEVQSVVEFLNAETARLDAVPAAAPSNEPARPSVPVQTVPAALMLPR